MLVGIFSKRHFLFAAIQVRLPYIFERRVLLSDYLLLNIVIMFVYGRRSCNLLVFILLLLERRNSSLPLSIIDIVIQTLKTRLSLIFFEIVSSSPSNSSSQRNLLMVARSSLQISIPANLSSSTREKRRYILLLLRGSISSKIRGNRSLISLLLLTSVINIHISI